MRRNIIKQQTRRERERKRSREVEHKINLRSKSPLVFVFSQAGLVVSLASHYLHDCSHIIITIIVHVSLQNVCLTV